MGIVQSHSEGFINWSWADTSWGKTGTAEGIYTPLFIFAYLTENWFYSVSEVSFFNYSAVSFQSQRRDKEKLGKSYLDLTLVY